MNTITGKLHFYSETGTEGGYYTLQRSEHITHVTPRWGIFKDALVYDPKDDLRSGKVTSAYREDGSAFTSSVPGEISFIDIVWDDKKVDIARHSNTVLVEEWDYNGLVYLRNGDKLTIYQKGIGSVALWDGTVSLVRQDPYAEDSFAAYGWACHHLPQNTQPVDAEDWSRWFFETRWASLDTKE